MKKLSLLSIMALVSCLFFVSCKKEKPTLETIVSAEDNSTAESEFSSAFDLGDDIATNDGRVKKAGSTILPNGAVLIFTDSLFNDGDGKDFSIDFGPLGSNAPYGMLCGDGRYRSGKIHFSLSGPYLNVGSILTITIDESDNFYSGNGVLMTKISGVKVIKRTQSNQYTVAVSNGKATNKNGSVTWNSNRTVTRTYDAGPGLIGDIFEVSGNASGTNRNGENFTVTIDLPLKKKFQLGCANTFVKGKLTLKNIDTNDEIQVDYDPFNNEACDKTAKATYKGKDYFFTVN